MIFNIEYKTINKYSVIVHSASYINPLEDIGLLETEIQKEQHEPCFILFDLLLSNGNEFNRFAEAYFDGQKILYDSIQLVEIIDDKLIDELNAYYCERTKELNASVLSNKEKYKFASYKQIM